MAVDPYIARKNAERARRNIAASERVVWCACAGCTSGTHMQTRTGETICRRPAEVPLAVCTPCAREVTP